MPQLGASLTIVILMTLEVSFMIVIFYNTGHRVKLADSDKHSSLLLYGNFYGPKSLRFRVSRLVFTKHFTNF
jgi:hypothetical protein